MGKDLVIIIVVVLAIGAVIGGLLIFLLRGWQVKQKAELKAFFDALGGQTTGSGGTFPCDGAQIAVYYFPGGENEPPFLEISLEGDFSGAFLVRRETGQDKFAKKIGLNQEVEIGDPDIDGKFYFECDDRDFVVRFLGQAEVKAFLKDSFSYFTSLRIQGNRCILQRRPFEGFAKLQPIEVKFAAQRLMQIAKVVPRSSFVFSSPAAVASDFERMKRRFFWIGQGLLASGGFSFFGMRFFEPVSSVRVFLASLWVGIPLAMLWMMLIFKKIKGRATSAGAFFSPALMGGIGFVLVAWTGTVFLNANRDTSVTQEHWVRVTDKHVLSGDSGDSYELTVSSWRIGQGAYKFKVSSSDYQKIPLSAFCAITTRAGFFGFEWVSSRRCEGK